MQDVHTLAHLGFYTRLNLHGQRLPGHIVAGCACDRSDGESVAFEFGFVAAVCGPGCSGHYKITERNRANPGYGGALRNDGQSRFKCCEPREQDNRAKNGAMAGWPA
jgi:hypothetical protein